MNKAIEAALSNHIREYDLKAPTTKAFEHFVNYIVLRNYKLYPVKRTRERVTFEPTSPVYGR